jgi:hypothetical protein
MKYPSRASNDLRIVALLLGLAIPLAAEAQTELVIKLDKTLCAGAGSVDVAYNQSDTPWPATKQPPDCTWKLKTGTINPKITFFSLRLPKIGRTPCRRARQEGDNLRIDFRYPGKGDVYNMEIDGPVFSYVRQVKTLERDDVPCEEEDTTRAPLYGVRLALEDLRVQVFEDQRVDCGVILDEVAPVKKITGSGRIDITPKDLAEAALAQGVKQKLCIAPTFLTAEVLAADLKKKNRAFTITATKVNP